MADPFVTSGGSTFPIKTGLAVFNDGSGNPVPASAATPFPITIIGGGTGNVDGPASSTDNAIIRFDGATGKLIQNSVNLLSDIGELQIPTTATLGLGVYNVGSQAATDFERLEALWSANVAIVRTTKGGTGTQRDLTLSASSNLFNLSAGSGNPYMFAGTSNSNTALQFVNIGTNLTSTATSGTIGIVRILPTYNQASGNAANTDLLINRTQTAVGSGAQFLIDAQVATVSQFSVSNGGAITTSVQALSGAGAINITQTSTDFTSTGGAQALTLANGTAGQIKTIVHVVDGGSGVLTPTTKIGFSTITFTNVGDSCTLRYSSAGWAIIGIFGATTA